MSELFDSLNFPPHWYGATAGTALTAATSPRRQHGTGRQSVADAAAKAAAAVDSWHSRRGSKSKGDSSSTFISSSTSSPHASTMFGIPMLEEAGPSSPPNHLEGRVFWNASPSPSLQLHENGVLNATSSEVPIGSQAFREELLRAPLSEMQSNNSSQQGIGQRKKAAVAQEDCQIRAGVNRRKPNRRPMRKSASNSASNTEPFSTAGLAELLDDLSDHYEENEAISDRNGTEKCTTHGEGAISLHTTTNADVKRQSSSTELRRSQTWARTSSMPTHSPSSRKDNCTNLEAQYFNDANLSILGKRHLPRSPKLNEDALSSPEKQAEQYPTNIAMTSMKENNGRCTSKEICGSTTPRRLQRTSSEGIRPSLGGAQALPSAKSMSPPKRQKVIATLGANRSLGPRVGLSKSARSAPAGFNTGCLSKFGNPSAQFKQPLRRSPRKSAATVPAHTAERRDESNHAEEIVSFIASNGGGTHDNCNDRDNQKSDSYRFHSHASLHGATDVNAPSTGLSRITDQHDSSFDTSMTSADESALCEVAELVEASQSISRTQQYEDQTAIQANDDTAQSLSFVDATGQATQQMATPEANHPSDDSLEMALGAEVDDAVLASMQAHGW